MAREGEASSGGRPGADRGRSGIAGGCRRRGLGTLLLRDALRRARGAGARFLALEVDVVNRDARRLYRREGFAVVRRFREDGRRRVEMLRRIARGAG